MTNRERLEEADILVPGEPWTQEETDSVESLNEQEMDLILNQGQDIRDVVRAHVPELSEIGAGKLANP